MSIATYSRVPTLKLTDVAPQPYPQSLLAQRSLLTDRSEFTQAMARAVTGVTIVTTQGRAGRFGLTVSAMNSLCADPPMLLICINRRSPIVAALTENEHFCVNVLGADQADLSDCFAGRPADGRAYDFGQAKWHLGPLAQPYLEGAVAGFECSLDVSQDFGTHRMFIGRVAAVHGAGGEPLLYTQRGYGRPQAGV